MKKGRFLAVILAVATVAARSLSEPNGRCQSAVHYAGGEHLVQLLEHCRGPRCENLGDEIRSKDYEKAYDSLANKAEFTEPEFMHDLTGYYPNLRTYSAMSHFDMQPLHATESEAVYRFRLHWATVVGDCRDSPAKSTWCAMAIAGRWSGRSPQSRRCRRR